jgi:hypothetical protein
MAKSNYRTAAEGSMLLSRPAAGGESCKQDSFLLFPHANRFPCFVHIFAVFSFHM